MTSQDSGSPLVWVCVLPYAKVYNVPGRCCGPLRSTAWWEVLKPVEVWTVKPHFFPPFPLAH